MAMFNVTYETITPESAQEGEFQDHGFLAENITLREALETHIDGIGCHVEANVYPVVRPRWFTFHKVCEDYATGEIENRSLHLPKGITPSSALRIARLIDCYGVK